MSVLKVKIIKLLSKNDLRKQCPLKWHENIPPETGISLGVADVDFEGPEGINEYIKSRLDDSFSFYQGQKGMDYAFNSIENYFDSKSIKVDKNNLQVIPGTMLGIYAAMKWASRREGKVICVGPIYEPIHRHATDNGNPIDWVNLENNKFDIDTLNNSVDNQTKMIAICNPTNPIGYIYSSSDLKGLRDIIIDNNLVCFSDELYEPLVFNQPQTSVLSIEGLKERSICLYGFSKAYGLAGYRSGFIHAGDDLIEEIRGITNSILVSPSPLSSIVCDFALSNEFSKRWVGEFRELMKSNTEIASKYFREAGHDCQTPDSCFFVFPDIGVDDAVFVPKLLENKGIQVVEGSHFGPTGVNHIRVNCATSKERLIEGIDLIITELRKRN
ncbi:MAG: Aspartate aminotransferase [Candidatus Heimdallarchaeota archaeon LC_2]|nr:MAG: Aspartate aminotransferase [Candidatus Heimdallarchaeota archaeon LC_2]